jgi:uncharacterized membrane protein YphA (DoxX/SURF4 family)
MVQRLFSGFPAGAPGAGLLLLRLTLGGYLIALGVRIIASVVDSGTPPTILAVLTAFAMLVGGVLGTVGMLTPVTQSTSSVAGLVTLIDASWAPAAVPGLDLPWPLSLMTTVVAVSLLLLGPGAYSIDASLFGRREVLIPPSSGPLSR